MEENSKSQAEKTRETYTLLGDTYLEDISKITPPELKDFIKLFPEKSKILEVGTAGGRDAKIFTNAGMNVTGVDVVDDFLAKAKKDVPEATFLHMDARNLDFPDNSFDGIYANAVLLHLNKKEVPPVLDSFYKILKPEGKLHIRLKSGEGEREITEKLSQNHSRFFSFFTLEETKNLLKNAGFKIIRAEEMPDDLGRDDLKWVSVWGEK